MIKNVAKGTPTKGKSKGPAKSKASGAAKSKPTKKKGGKKGK